jgi:hypothetical protein
MMAEETASARFVRAVYQLATGTGSLQERLAAAWLELMPLKREDLPERLQEAFTIVEADMLHGPEDVSSLSDDDAFEAAERLFRFAIELWGS